MVLVLPVTAAIAAGEKSPERLVLAPGVVVERALGAGGADRFGVELEAGKPWRIRVEQLGVDVVVEVLDPARHRLLMVDTPLGREGAESLVVTPARSGRHFVVVRSQQRGVPDGRYRIDLQELATDTTTDRLRLRAETAVSDASRIRQEAQDGAGQRAVAKLRAALELWETLGDRRQAARTWFAIGRFSDQLDDYRQAVASYGEALTLWGQEGDARGMAAALDGRGLAHQNLGEHPQALTDLQRALALRQGLGKREREVETRNHLCLVLQRSGRFDAAGTCYERTLALARAFDDRELEATVLNNLGGIYQNLGEPAKQLEYLRQALSLRRALGDEMGEAITRNNLGAFHRRLGEVEEALLAYGPALAIFERLDSRYWQARTLNNIGFAYLTLGELERARAYLLRALPLRRDVGDKSGEAVTLVNLGRVFSRLGETGRALAFDRKSLANNLATGNRRGATAARRALGELYLKRHEPAAARTELALALASLREMGNRRQAAEVLELLSRVHLELGEHQQARALAGQALAIQRRVQDPVGEVTTLTTLARVDRALGRSEAASEHLEAALGVLEAVHGRLGDPDQRASFLATQRAVYELDIDFLMQRHWQAPEKGYDRAALAVSEKARSRALLGLLEQVGAGPGGTIEPALAERLRAAERRFAAKTRRQRAVTGREHTGAEALAAEQELYRALAALDNLRAEIRRRSPRYASLRGTLTLDAVSMRALLDDDTVLMEFFLGERRSFLWWVTPASVTAYSLPPRAEIEALATRVHQQISAIHRRSVEDKQVLDALGRMLLGPVADRLRAHRLVVVADGALHLVPFAALTLPEGDRQPVLAHHEVVYLPSASVLDSQRRARAAGALASETVASKTVAIFADPIFDRRDPRIAGGLSQRAQAGLAGRRERERTGLGTLDRLLYTRREAEVIAALVPASQRLLALGGDARRARVLDGALGAYRILHFATHGVVDSRNPALSGLILAQLDAEGRVLDGFLGLHDVSNLELKAELVVLSACRTALGKQIRGEGLIGLTRGFMYAGVPRVVASLWQVRDEATAKLMSRFYSAMLTEGLSPAKALRLAQLALRQERRFRDPFYWAAFSLQGDWRSP